MKAYMKENISAKISKKIIKALYYMINYQKKNEEIILKYIDYYKSNLGKILLAADDIGLTGLWFEEQKYYALNLEKEHTTKQLPVFEKTKEWLDIYFSGRELDFELQLHFIGTEFQKEVWEILCTIPYGTTITYGQIAKQIAKKRGLKSMSAQAVGGAVGHNPISIIVPCHRVLGSDGSLTGYAGGMDRKVALLGLERVNGYGAEFVDENALSVMVKRLRDKL